MKRKNFKINRIIALMLLTSIFTFAFVWTNPSASEQSNDRAKEQKAIAEAGNHKTIAELKGNDDQEPPVAALKAERRGFPLLNLQDGRKLQTKYVGADGAEQSLSAAQGQPLTMTNADLNADGVAELIVGYGGVGGGRLTVYQGNPDTLSARTPEVFEAMKQGQFPAPFLSEARLISLPAAPDFIGAGDFNRDGWKDIIAAQRGDNRASLLLGNSKGGYRLSYVELPGQATAMLVDNIDPLDNAADIAFAVEREDGASLLIYNGGADAFGAEPEVYQLPAAAVSLAIGQLDNDAPMDILATGGGRAVIIHGAYPNQTEQNDALRSNQVETLTQGFDVAAARVGNFVWDRENRPEIGLLGADGLIRILERGKLDKRPFSEAELKARPLRMREQLAEQEAVRNLNYQPRQGKTIRQKWTEVDRFQTSAPTEANRGAASTAFFTSARMTPLGVEDLIVLDSASRKLHVLVSNNDEMKKSGERFALSASGERAVVTFEAEGASAAVMPMRLSVMNRPGLVLLDKESGEISYAPAAPAATFTVTKTADTYDGACNADCSFREALQAANASNTSDIIMVPAGTYTISPALGGPDQDTVIDPAAQQSGDWDVIYDTTITGAGQASTILQAGATTATGHDRVLDAIQTGVGIPDLTISGVTIQNGRCRSDFPCVDGGGLRYAVDALSVLTISDSTITGNRTEVNTGNPANNGGGIFGGTSTSNFTNMTVTNNTTAFVVSGCTGATQCGGEGGGVFAGITNNTNPVTVTMTNCAFTGNTANSNAGLGGRGGAYAGSPNSVSISGGTFSSNIAFTDGGAFRLFTPTTISGASTTISNNTARQNGGGIWSDPLANNNTPLTNTFTNVVMKGNTADSDGVIGVNNNNRGDGGAIFHGRGTLNLNNPTIGGAGAGEGNTAYDGGGIARTYSQFTSAIFNASTLNINSGGSIVGNQAINNGGGIINDATKSAAAGNASVLNMTGATAVTFTNNKARNHGGGIAVVTGAGSSGPAAAANLNNMTLRSNQSNSDSSGGGDGGALYQDSGSVSGGGTTFTGSLTIGGSGFANSAVNGGGVRNAAGIMTIPASASITFNTATGTGGGISNAGTLSALVNSNISNNTATGNGGGIFNSGILGSISGHTINTNSAATGGGVFSSNGVLSMNGGIVNSNIANTGKGGGIEHSGSSASIISNSAINNNTGSGILITGTGSIDVKTNTITGNSGDGIGMTGTGTGSNFESNTIHTNGELGIDLSDNGVTLNDANDTDIGPNNLQNYPVINYVRRGDGVANFTLNAANGSYRIQFYANTACDPSGNGEGEVLLASQTVTVAGNTFTGFSDALAFGSREQITAIATSDPNNNGNFDDDGSTSEFSACRKVNTLPTFPTVQTPSRQQGSPSSNSQIATVTDPDQTLNTLAVTVKAVGAVGPGGASATVNGVTVSNIVVDAMGNVTADVVASCTATNANFTLRVTDNATEFNETALTVNVTLNTPPTLGTYPNTTVNLGSSGTVVTPNAAPTDNGTVATLTAAAPGFTGTFVGNTATGAVTVNSATPSGVYTVTVTATDNCGATTTATFQLTVNAPPTITGATISRQQGSPSANSQIATVNDIEDAENTLAVTVNGGASATVTGVTVSNILVDVSGNVTADVVASCTATNASFTLRVGDSNGAFSEAALNVTVTANTPPTAGTYSNTSLAPGSGTTATPSAAPADNGSIASITASAPSFTGTFSGNTSTGAITVNNAGPAGIYTVTVTITDNCGATATKTFTLTVTTPPTINPATGVDRQRGGPVSNSQIATVNDADQTEETLVVTVNGSASATVNGVTVSNIAVSAAGNVTADIVAAAGATDATFTLRVTDAQGAFTEAVLTVTVFVGYEGDVATRPVGDGSVDVFDLVAVGRIIALLDAQPAIGSEFQRADAAPRTSGSTIPLGDGFIDVLDLVQIGRYSAVLDPLTPAGGPTAPAPPAAAAAESNQPKVQSNQSSELASTSNVMAPATISAGSVTASNTTAVVPIQLTTTGDVEAIQFSITFDATKLSLPADLAVAFTNRFPNTTFIFNTATPGQIGVVAFQPLDGVSVFPAGTITLFNINFTVVGTPSGTTSIDFGDSPIPRRASDPAANPVTVVTTPGTVTFLGTTAATVSVSGRVISTTGRGIGGVRLSLTDSQGNVRTATTTSFGYYRFDDVQAGGTYILSASSKRYTFSQPVQVLNINEETNQIDFIANPKKG